MVARNGTPSPPSNTTCSGGGVAGRPGEGAVGRRVEGVAARRREGAAGRSGERATGRRGEETVAGCKFSFFGPIRPLLCFAVANMCRSEASRGRPRRARFLTPDRRRTSFAVDVPVFVKAALGTTHPHRTPR